MLVAGVDSSTQGTKIVVRRADTGEPVRAAQAPHPDGTEIDPRHWWEALLAVCADGMLEGVSAIGVAAQQHGMVALDSAGEVVRPALLWNDNRSAGAARDLIAELGGPRAWAQAVGSVPVASLTVTKLRWLAEHEPANAARAERVLLPHDWLTWRLTGGTGGGEALTDRGDASGTGYYSPAEGAYRTDLLRAAFGRDLATPRVAGPADTAGPVRAAGLPGIGTVSVGTGDNMAAALGLGAGPGDVVVSLGTSGTAFAVAEEPTADPSGLVTGFADATGRFLPLVCTLNAARVLDAGARMLGVDLAEFGRLALEAPSGAHGLTLLPYLDGERTPNLPDATGRLDGLTRANLTPPAIARAFVEGMLCGLADAVDALTAQDVPVRRVLLIGGAARSAAVRAIAPQILGRPVVVPEPGEYVADGAARQAAWALAGTAEPPEWGSTAAAETYEADPAPGVRERYAQARAALTGTA
ncbi:xylulokinase [Streptomonospora nanhaiensis]|uniref:Xylulose kinase n=1 Tax=Streptomonospora nanhaiensis TaxID=1323731 RepID=A0A853BW82_9ACTN|nr:xylulokinase [Streptomonospora nanhaiensis]MBV2363695.1 xylulokinase [Streptomonospora nanhaiensis]MBX9387715.1 xylulokinase [Streptomonospora nanhaiensis]MBX9390883.1 xylulokinase [Streptomonospora nanhaiensis]NYI98741.1 xylulokinase [Streptomonospora nanhaiensis]